MMIQDKGQLWAVVDMTWDGWVAVRIVDGMRTHRRGLFPFAEVQLISVS